ncbi:PAS domain S-box protein [Chloroflexota bacterium]
MDRGDNTQYSPSDTDEIKEVSCRVSNSIFKYVDSLGYDSSQLSEGLSHSTEFLTNPFNWIGISTRDQLCYRAAELCNDKIIMYKVGLAASVLRPFGGFEQLVKLLGSPKVAYRSIPKYAQFFDKTIQFNIVDISNNQAKFNMRLRKGESQLEHGCYFAQGILAAIPTLWGCPIAEIREIQCMCEPSEGRLNQTELYRADSCQYEVAWQNPKSRFRELLNKLHIFGGFSRNVTDLEAQFLLQEEHAAALRRRNIEILKIREMALGVDSVRTVDDVYQLVVDSARDIPGVRFVIVQQLDESNQNIITPYFSKIRSESIKKALKVAGFDVDKTLGKNPSSRTLQLPVSKMKLAQDFIKNPRIISREHLSELLDGVWPTGICDAIQRIVGIKNFVLVPVLAETVKKTTLVFFIESEVQHEILEMVAAHCATAINNVTLLENQQRILEELNESREMLRLTVESIVEGITVTDLETNIIEINWAMIQIYGYTKKNELVDKSVLELINERDRRKFSNSMKLALENRHFRSTEYLLLRRDGSEFIGEVSIAVIRNAAGLETGFVTITRDISERKQAEKERMEFEQKTQLSDRLASIGEMSAGIAHEINNPLTGVIGYSDLLIKKDLPKKIKNDVIAISEAGHKVASVVSRLLTFARQLEPRKELVNINRIIETTLEMRNLAEQVDNIRVTTEFDAELPKTVADASQLQQVFLNIILNAEKAMSTNRRGNFLLKTEKIDDTIQISFTDDGHGITKKDLDKIFNPFFTTRKVGEGTGLGLSVCHGIITEHNGTIRAESEWGKGTTIIIELPIIAKIEQTVKIDLETEATGVKPVKILVVDDEPVIQEYLSTVLRKDGHEVESVDNGEDAIERLGTDDYDVILLDIKLPGKTGIEIYDWLQQNFTTLIKRVVIMTGDVMGRETLSFMSKTKVPYITKPFNSEQIKQVVAKIITEN